MAGRRIVYVLAWLGCVIFFVAYQEWLSFLLLCAISLLPLFSLLISLPAMLTARLELSLPNAVNRCSTVVLQPKYKCRLPLLFHKCTVVVMQPLTGLKQKLKPGEALPTGHCGTLYCTVTRAGVCDYLGLFRIPLRRPQPYAVSVRPIPAPMHNPPDPQRHTQGFWRPKPGGGFAENHELRLYRPGDSIHQIHWKLSAKTGKLILREPMELRRKPIGLYLLLQGSPEELDRKLDRLLWLGNYLLDKNIPFDVHCHSADGPDCFPVSSQKALSDTIDRLLTKEPSTDSSVAEPRSTTQWLYGIGGGSDET